MYRKLLISAGGGIIPKEQQAEQNEVATIAIGLGGTGISCLRTLKHEIYERIKPDNDNSLIPHYKHIKFLAVDTDRYSLGAEGVLGELDYAEEFLDLRCTDVVSLLECAAVLKNNPSLQWLKAASTQHDRNGIEVQSSDRRVLGVRQIGRLLLMQNCQEFVHRLKNIITRARHDLPENAEINIHIFTGMSGSTGSGIFLDVCYLIQHILDDMELHGVAHTYGYFFLPDVNINNISITNVQELVKSNGYAAMKELDYCMNFDLNGGEWNQEYHGFRIHTSEPPVGLAHLITATDLNGMVHKNAYNYSMNVVADYVMDLIIKHDDSDWFSFKSYIADKWRVISSTPKMHGAGYKYCVIGTANAYVPYKEITTYLTSKIFEGFARIDHQLPSDNDIDLFVQTTGLKYEDICKDLRAKVPAVPLFEVDTKTIYEQTKELSPDVIPQVLGQMRDSLARIGGQIAENKRNMLKSLEIINEDAQIGISSLISRVRKKIIEISQQPDKGPYYGGAILHGVKARDLKNKIDGYIEQNSRNLIIARADMSLREQSIAQTLRNLQDSNVLNRKKCGRDYVQAVYLYFRQQADVEFYTALGDILVSFKKQVSDLYTQEFAVFENVLRQLESIFSANIEALSNPSAEENDYAIKLITIKDLQESLDTHVKKMRIDDLISGFVRYMLNNTDIWIAQDESKIAYAVSQFFLKQLEQFTSKTIVDYLKIKFETEDLTILADKIYSDIVLPLSAKATPLFWFDRTKYWSPEVTYSFCTIPQISCEVMSAAETYRNSHPYTHIRPSFCIDRISFLKFYVGIPMFAYNGVDDYRGAKRIIGAHIYEGATGDERDWRNLYDITPFSCISEDQCTEVLKEKAHMVDDAKELGIFVKKNIGTDAIFEYVLREFDLDKVNEDIATIDDVMVSGDENAMQSCYDSFVNYEPIIKSEHIIKNIGDYGCEDLAAKDLVIASNVMLDIIAKQKPLIEKRKILLEDLESKVKRNK